MENREIILNTVNDGRNYIGGDNFGNTYYSQVLNNGKQAWARVRNGQITNAGINDIPLAPEQIIAR